MTKTLTNSSSVYLDILRFLCAFFVFYSHVFLIYNYYPKFYIDIGHWAVVVFFVLSGYVITFSTTLKKRTANEYVVARLSRLYSIFFPAIIVTIVCAILVFMINKQVFNEFSNGNNIIRYLISTFYLNEIWFFSSAPRINGPLWSLSFEFFFYAIFGAFLYKKSGMKGLVLPILLCLIAGPKILLMMVVWLFGVLAYKAPKLRLPITLNWFFSIVFLLLSILIIKWLPHYPFQLGQYPFYMGNQFLSDYLSGFSIAISIWFLPLKNINSESKSKGKMEGGFFRKLGDLTFPVYVLHYPIMVLLKSMLVVDEIDKTWLVLITLIITLTICIVLGLYLESKKQNYRLLFETLVYNLTSFKRTNLLGKRIDLKD